MRRKVDVDDIDCAAQRVIETFRTVAIMLRDRQKDVFLVSVLDKHPEELRKVRLKRWNVVSGLAERAMRVMDTLLKGGPDLFELGATNLIQGCDAAIQDVRSSLGERASAESEKLDELLDGLRAISRGSLPEGEISMFYLRLLLMSEDSSEKWSQSFVGLSEQARAYVLAAVEKLPADSQSFFKEIFLKPPLEQNHP